MDNSTSSPEMNTVPTKKIGKFDSFFGITKSGSNIRTEIIAGIVTFLAMAYILVVNPQAILSQNTTIMDTSSIFLATALGAVVGTLLMAFLAKLPLAQASGMGLNYTVGALFGGSLGFAVSYGNAMLLVLISGLLFLALSVIRVKGVAIRELIFDGIPECVRGAISVGIGLFIAFIGMQNAGLIVSPGFPILGDAIQMGENVILPYITYIPGTLVDLVQFNNFADPYVASGAVVCLIGFLSIAILEHFKVKGSVIIGILIATLVGIPFGVTTWSGESWAFWENFGKFFSFDPANGGAFGAAFTEGFTWAEGAKIMPIIMTIITFCMIDMFDTMGTVVGCCTPAGLIDQKGKPLNYNKIMISDSVATCAGACFGTSTVTTFVESGAGVAAGGKTGLTALTTAILFALSILLFPLIASIPGPAAASALLYVGCLMLKGIKNVKIDGVKNYVPAFLTIAMMPLAYSITDGIGFGILSYVIIDLVCYLISTIKYAFTKKEEDKPVWDLHVVTIIVAVLFLVYFFVPTTF
ncbi:MAG: NCS2 family permease [Clostridiales bacterium]|nr:NCS2 family permease [Clostridiales bacterium]